MSLIKYWVNPATGHESCPECDGFGTREDDTECRTCHGDGAATIEDAAVFLHVREPRET